MMQQYDHSVAVVKIWEAQINLRSAKEPTEAPEAESEGEEKEPEFDEQDNATMAESTELQ